MNATAVAKSVKLLYGKGSMYPRIVIMAKEIMLFLSRFSTSLVVKS